MIASGKLSPSENRKRISKKDKNPMDQKSACSDIQAPEVRKVFIVQNKILALIKSINFMGPEIAINFGNPAWQVIKWDVSNDTWEENDSGSNMGCPSKFLILCLNTIQNSLQQNGSFTSDRDRPLFASSWGLEFWNCYTNGNDILDSGGVDLTIERISWITSTAADTISMKEKEGLSFNGPFLLYLVPSQDKAFKVCQMCVFLEVVGIRTVCLHSGASVDHQIHSLQSYEPEFLVSTPERLLELLSLKAVDISEVSLMVVDELKAPIKGTTYQDAIKSIRQFITGSPQTVVFCDCK